MKYISFCLIAIAAFMAFSEDALAHRVNVFAFVDGDEIQVECSLSRSQKVKNGKLIVTDTETGVALLEATTDEQGLYRFRPAEEFLQSGHGLNIRLLAGEGHQDDWKISPEDLKTLSKPSSSRARTEPRNTPTIQSGQSPARAAPLTQIDPAELEAIIGKVLDEKLTPIKQALARKGDDEPGLRDIIGGIGWILGLLGLAAYLKYRR